MQFNPADGGKIVAPNPKDPTYEDPEKYRFPPGINNQGTPCGSVKCGVVWYGMVWYGVV